MKTAPRRITPSTTLRTLRDSYGSDPRIGPELAGPFSLVALATLYPLKPAGIADLADLAAPEATHQIHTALQAMKDPHRCDAFHHYLTRQRRLIATHR